MTRHTLTTLVLALVGLLAGCSAPAEVGPERSIGPGGYVDSDVPHNVAEMTPDGKLTLSSQGDPTALQLDDSGVWMATEGPGTALGYQPDGTLYLYSPKDVSIASVRMSVDDGGRPTEIEVSGLNSDVSTVRAARAQLAVIVAGQVAELAEAERAAVVESYRIMAEAGSEFASAVLAALPSLLPGVLP